MNKKHLKKWRKAWLRLYAMRNHVKVKTVRVWYNWFICEYAIWYHNGTMYHFYPTSMWHKDLTKHRELFQSLNWDEVANDSYYVIDNLIEKTV